MYSKRLKRKLKLVPIVTEKICLPVLSWRHVPDSCYSAFKGQTMKGLQILVGVAPAFKCI